MPQDPGREPHEGLVSANTFPVTSLTFELRAIRGGVRSSGGGHGRVCTRCPVSNRRASSVTASLGVAGDAFPIQ